MGRKLIIGGREILYGGALTVARLGHIEADGLLLAALFDSIYFCHYKRYMVVE